MDEEKAVRRIIGMENHPQQAEPVVAEHAVSDVEKDRRFRDGRIVLKHLDNPRLLDGKQPIRAIARVLQVNSQIEGQGWECDFEVCVLPACRQHGAKD